MEFLLFILGVYAFCLLGLAYKQGKWEAVKVVGATGIQTFAMGAILGLVLKVFGSFS